MPIQPHKIDLLRSGHADGLLNPELALRAGVSIATVKRYRTQLGLDTHCVTARRGRLGERVTAERAALEGRKVEWRLRENAGHDLIVAGRRVDAKAAMRQADGSWRFRLPVSRPSFYGQHRYPKDYAADCEVLALVALYPGGEPADVYLLESAGAPRNLRIERGGAHRHLEEAWQVFGVKPQALQA